MTKMAGATCLMIFVLLNYGLSFANETAITSSGRKVILRDNGTWEHYNNPINRNENKTHMIMMMLSILTALRNGLMISKCGHSA